MYTILYHSWSRSVYSLLVLNLLCGCYQHCCDLLDFLLEGTITYDLITTLDKVVRVVESAGFASESNYIFFSQK